MHQHVSTRFGKVAFETHGEGLPLVLLHSGGHDRHDFDAVVPALARRHRTVALDLPGHGDSAMFEPPSSATARAICEGVEDALDALDLGPAILRLNRSSARPRRRPRRERAKRGVATDHPRGRRRARRR